MSRELLLIGTFTIIIICLFHFLFLRQKFQNCLKRFDIIDNTLLKLGTITDYDKLRRKVMWYALGWIVIVILTTYCAGLILKEEHDGVIASTMYFSFLRDYCFHINFMGDLINASILELVYILTYTYNHIFILWRSYLCKYVKSNSNPIFHHF